MGSQLNQAVFAGSYSVRAPRRSSAAMAGLMVIAVAGAAFWLGFNTERNRPMPVTGTPLAAIAAVPLQRDELAALIYPQGAVADAAPAAPAKAPPATAAGPKLLAAYAAPATAFSAASADARVDAAETGPAAAPAPVADVGPAAARDPVGDLLAAY